MTNNSKKWYDNAVLTNVILFLFFPVGLYGLWKSNSIAKWWKITGTILIAILVIASFGDEEKKGSNKNDDAISTVDSSDYEQQPVSQTVENWEYMTDEDGMTGDKKFFARTRSTNMLHFEFPYNGGSEFYLTIRNSAGKTDVYMSVTTGQFLPSFGSSDYVRVKFDDGDAVQYAYNSAEDGSSDVVFLTHQSRFIQNLKKAKKLKIEAPFFEAGRQIVEFDVEGLDWK